MNHSGITAARSVSARFCWKIVLSAVAVMKYVKPRKIAMGNARPGERTSANAARLTANVAKPIDTRCRRSMRERNVPTARAPMNAPRPHVT